MAAPRLLMSRGDADPARLSEEQALRRSFDVRNRRVLPWVLWPMGVFFFGNGIILSKYRPSATGAGW